MPELTLGSVGKRMLAQQGAPADLSAQIKASERDAEKNDSDSGSDSD